MRRELKKHSLIEHIHEDPDPLPRPMNGAYLIREGYEKDGSAYFKDEISLWYDGAFWWVFFWCAMFRIETIEEFEKLVKHE